MAASDSTTKPTGFLTAVARIHLSHLFRDPFIAAAFKAAEDDGLPDLVETDHPKHLDGGAAEVIGDTGRRVLAELEG
jgi:hypothetical protein